MERERATNKLLCRSELAREAPTIHCITCFEVKSPLAAYDELSVLLSAKIRKTRLSGIFDGHPERFRNIVSLSVGWIPLDFTCLTLLFSFR